jgi:hypothetical protein
MPAVVMDHRPVRSGPVLFVERSPFAGINRPTIRIACQGLKQYYNQVLILDFAPKGGLAWRDLKTARRRGRLA